MELEKVVVTFNTGRKYTTEGQIITAVFIPERVDEEWELQIGTLYFNDESRGILGKYNHVSFNQGLITGHEVEQVLMAMYDRGGYDFMSTYDFNQLVQEG